MESNRTRPFPIADETGHADERGIAKRRRSGTTGSQYSLLPPALDESSSRDENIPSVAEQSNPSSSSSSSSSSSLILSAVECLIRRNGNPIPSHHRHRLLLQGPVGSGKSSLLMDVALDLARTTPCRCLHRQRQNRHLHNDDESQERHADRTLNAKRNASWTETTNSGADFTCRCLAVTLLVPTITKRAHLPNRTNTVAEHSTGTNAQTDDDTSVKNTTAPENATPHHMPQSDLLWDLDLQDDYQKGKEFDFLFDDDGKGANEILLSTLDDDSDDDSSLDDSENDQDEFPLFCYKLSSISSLSTQLATSPREDCIPFPPHVVEGNEKLLHRIQVRHVSCLRDVYRYLLTVQGTSSDHSQLPLGGLLLDDLKSLFCDDVGEARRPSGATTMPEGATTFRNAPAKFSQLLALMIDTANFLERMGQHYHHHYRQANADSSGLSDHRVLAMAVVPNCLVSTSLNHAPLALSRNLVPFQLWSTCIPIQIVLAPQQVPENNHHHQQEAKPSDQNLDTPSCQWRSKITELYESTQRRCIPPSSADARTGVSEVERHQHDLDVRIQSCWIARAFYNDATKPIKARRTYDGRRERPELQSATAQSVHQHNANTVEIELAVVETQTSSDRSDNQGTTKSNICIVWADP